MQIRCKELWKDLLQELKARIQVLYPGLTCTAGAVIRNNVVIGSHVHGIYVIHGTADTWQGMGDRNLQIYHNTLINNAGYGLYFSVRPTGQCMWLIMSRWAMQEGTIQLQI